MNYKKILILKNDRGGDLFSSLKTLSTLRNEYKDITIFLSEFNYGSYTLYPFISALQLDDLMEMLNER